jgi:hypothetical protein
MASPLGWLPGRGGRLHTDRPGSHVFHFGLRRGVMTHRPSYSSVTSRSQVQIQKRLVNVIQSAMLPFCAAFPLRLTIHGVCGHRPRHVWHRSRHVRHCSRCVRHHQRCVRHHGDALACCFWGLAAHLCVSSATCARAFKQQQGGAHEEASLLAGQASSTHMAHTQTSMQTHAAAHLADHFGRLLWHT